MVKIGNSWDDLLKDEFQKDYYKNLHKFLKSEYSHHIIYPNMFGIFNALKYTAYEDVKVVIIGQDPYHEEGQAHGLCFSVKENVPFPPSLKNIFKELNSDFSSTVSVFFNGHTLHIWKFLGQGLNPLPWQCQIL